MIASLMRVRWLTSPTVRPARALPPALLRPARRASAAPPGCTPHLMPGAYGHDRISTAMPATQLIQSQGALLTSDQVDSAVTDPVTGAGYEKDAYPLALAGLRPLPWLLLCLMTQSSHQVAHGWNSRFSEPIVKQLEPVQLGWIGLEIAASFSIPAPRMRARLNSDNSQAGQDAVRFVGITSQAELQQANLAGGEDELFIEAAAKAGKHQYERQFAVLEHMYPAVQEEAARQVHRLGLRRGYRIELVVAPAGRRATLVHEQEALILAGWRALEVRQ